MSGQIASKAALTTKPYFRQHTRQPVPYGPLVHLRQFFVGFDLCLALCPLVDCKSTFTSARRSTILTIVGQAGGLAGTAVDLSLYPLDTLKTRLQSAGGFFKNGGWSGVYKGIGSVIAGSAPGAALFFVSYEHVKTTLRHDEKTGSSAAITHMLAASIGEIAACSVRVPTEVIKQRAQASQFASSWQALRHIFTANISAIMVWRELYRGWGITIMREIPFTVIQFPLWEAMKKWRGEAKGRKANPAESAVFGSVSGAVAAAATTPLDVLKTRLMLAKQVCLGPNQSDSDANEVRL